MGGALHLQAPGGSGPTLLATLSAASRDAESGGGIFAFATADGIRALLGGDGIGPCLAAAPFDLVVGVDAVTDERALDELIAARSRHPTLDPRVLVHRQAVLFHPKLAWFRRGDTLTLVVGSGNLTVRGMCENWEAFATVALEGSAAHEAERQLAGWHDAHASLLHTPDADAARAQARRNTGRERDLKHPRRARPTAEDDGPPDSSEVLVAAATHSGGGPDARSSQVNFKKRDYEGFFGIGVGGRRSVRLYAVAADGTVVAERERTGGARRSRNFAFELSAFRGPPLAPGRHAIGVYVRLPQGGFLYQCVRPGEPGHDELRRFLDLRWEPRGNQLARATAPLAEVRAAWPTSPLWTATVPSS